MARRPDRPTVSLRRTTATFGAVVSAIVLGAAALTGCTGMSTPAPTPTTATSASSTAATTSTLARPPRTSSLARYDVRRLIGSNIYAFPVGRAGPHGGVLLAQTIGISPISVAGATGPVSMYIPCCSDSQHLMLVYQVGSTRPPNPTQIPIADDQGVVLDGRLIAIHAIMRVGSQPRVEAQVIVFPAAASSGLPVVK